MNTRFTFSFFLILVSGMLWAQSAKVQGSFFDQDDEPLVAAYVLFLQNNVVISGATTNQDGAFSLENIKPGNYRMIVTYQEDTVYLESFSLTGGEVLLREHVNVKTGNVLKPVDVRFVKTENIDEFKDTAIIFGPIAETITKVAPTVNLRNGAIVVGGGRPDGTQIMIDNATGTIGRRPISTIGIEGTQIIDLGVPARYGNFTGGGLQYKTKQITSRNETKIQVQSGSLFNRYHHNLGVVYYARPLKVEVLKSKDGEKEVKRLVLGYSVLGTYRFEADPTPSPTDIYVVKDGAYQKIFESPLSTSQNSTSLVQTGSFLTADDLERRAARPNAARHDAELRFKTSYNPTPNLTFDFVNQFEYLNRRLSQGNYVLMNSSENPQQIYSGINSRLVMTHNVRKKYNLFGERLLPDSVGLSNLSYTVDLNYQETNSQVFNARHGQNIFDYGYVGKFKTIRAPQYIYNTNGSIKFIDEQGKEQTLTNYVELSGYRDSFVGFEAGNQNPILANQNRILMDIGGINSLNELNAKGGFLNGQNIPLLYSLYSNPGEVYGSYSKSFQKRFSAMAFTEATFHPFKNNPRVSHQVDAGITYMQDQNGYYSLSASRLWQLMPLLTNSHIQSIDKNNPIFSTDENGRFTDTVSYPVYVDAENQKHFDKMLRDKLMADGYRDANGNLITQESFIDINALSPETFDLSMFTADELLNSGNSFVAYSGYDYLGNRTNKKAGIENFIKDAKNRPIDAFSPVTTSAWLQDKFIFKQLVVSAGLRFERYDANQQVLKDPYVLFPTYKVGDVSAMNGIEVKHPEGIGNDFVVYVDNVDNPTRITGYRNGSIWYNNQGIEISDPSLLANESGTGRIQPFLVDPEHQELSSASFKDYEPQNLFLPRIAVSFPIDATKLIFFSYDKLAQQPNSAQTYAPLSTYYYLQSNISGVLPNPELRARVKTEYNFGLKQNIGRWSSLKLTASYATMANDFNQIRIEQAYPYSYTTYGNIDFATIKRYIAEFEYDNNRVFMNVNYALQFADGTGSNTNSAASLIQSGQPNLRSLYPLSYDVRHGIKGSFVYQFGDKNNPLLRYSGPMMGKHSVLNNTFVSLTFQAFSGTPYTATSTPVSEAQAANGVVQRSQIKGNPFGSRLVWNDNLDLRIQKTFMVKNKLVGAYVAAENVLNRKTVQNVYSYSGLPNDDGYLNSLVGQQQIQNQINAETFAMLYKIRMNNPFNYGTPRMMHVGMNLTL
ncbi:MAG: carboxypeptidase regulatory-like domain-containing protein [Flavobacteriales bacterium]|nr:carboxypeptidase regulatory-like domain-containing protein [Flavobacteriales bacterium]